LIDLSELRPDLKVINPVVTEPVVQFSLYLQIKYLFDK